MTVCCPFVESSSTTTVSELWFDGATSEWISIVSGVPLGSVLGPHLFILYASEMFELMKIIQYAYADDSTLLAVVRKPADRPAVAAFLNRDLARIQEWCNHWCMIKNPNKIKALVVSRSRTVNPPHGDLVDHVWGFHLR